MSVEAMSVVLHHSRASGTRKLVLLGIANHQGDGGAWPGIDKLATYANVNPRNVQRAIEALVGMGELRVSVQQGGGRDTPDHRRPNRYDVLVECPSGCDRTTQHRTRRTRQRQLELSTGVAAAPPVPGDGVAAAPPHGVAAAPPEPSPRTITPHHPTQSPTGQARGVSCVECSAPSREVCEQRQLKLRATDRHTYRPRLSGATR
jgi:hypothetical protein